MRRIAGLCLACVALVGLLHQPAVARERVHYIAAEDILWNYAPQGRDIIADRPLPRKGVAQLGWTYHKAVYVEYTDSTFRKRTPISAVERYLGFVGPVIHAEVGDSIIVVLRNRTTIPVDIAPNGVSSIPRPAAVMPGSTRTFRWPIANGPSSADESSILFSYASDAQPGEHTSGLIGPLIVTRRGSALADGSPSDVDREIVTLFSSQLENQNPLLAENLHDRSINPKGIRADAASFFPDNAYPSINGYIYGNMPMITLHDRERVRWYLLTTANGFDGHTPTWSGQTVLFQGNRSDAVGLIFRDLIADMVPDNTGIWLLNCSNDIHLADGMEGRYQVLP